MKASLYLALMCGLAAFSSGCGTIVANTGLGHLGSKPPPEGYYAGTRFDSLALRDSITKGHTDPPETCIWYITGPVFFLIDTPLSLVADTFLVPFELNSRGEDD